MTYSLIEIFGELPVHPDKFATLDWKLKWIDTPTEGGNFCVRCGTLTPQFDVSHHKECVYYFPTQQPRYDEPNPLGVCPDCGSEDGLSIDSSWELQMSRISCIDCNYSFEDNVDEESLIDKFKKTNKDTTN